MLFATLGAVAALAIPIAAHAAKPAVYAITIIGSYKSNSTNETDGVSEGGACHFRSVWKGQDSLSYESEKPVAAALTAAGGSVNLRVHYRYNVNGWRDSSTILGGDCPNGVPPFPDHAPGCHTYTGVFVVHVVIAHGKVAVSSDIHEFAGDGLCPGGRSLGVMLSKARIDLTKLLTRSTATVSGTGPDPSVRLAPGWDLHSQFTLRFAKR